MKVIKDRQIIKIHSVVPVFYFEVQFLLKDRNTQASSYICSFSFVQVTDNNIVSLLLCGWQNTTHCPS